MNLNRPSTTCTELRYTHGTRNLYDKKIMQAHDLEISSDIIFDKIILIKPTMTSSGFRHTNIPWPLHVLEVPPQNLVHTRFKKKRRDYCQDNPYLQQ